MAKRKIEVELRAKNAMQRGLASAGAAMKKFGESALRIGKFFAKGFLAAGAAVAGFAAKAIHAYASKEKAERAVISSLQAHGEAGEALLPLYKRLADAIQKETGLNDETTLQRAANIRMLGVQTDQMEDALKGIVALTRAGMGEETAQRAMAAAMGGNYSMLTRYIPALRDVTDEAEKARIVNDFLAKGYDAQTKELDTVAGQFGLLKENIADAWAETGRAISQNDLLMDGIKKAQLAVADFVESIQAWVEGGGVVNLLAGFKHFFAEAQHIFQMIGNSAAVAWSSMADGFDTVVKYLQGVAEAFFFFMIREFQQMGEMAQAAWNLVRNPGRAAFRELRELSERHRKETVDNLKGIGAAFAGHDAAVTKRTEAALKDRRILQERHADRIKAISEEQSAALIANNEEVARKAKEAAEAEEAMALSVGANILENARELTLQKKAEIKKRVQTEREAGREIGDIAGELHADVVGWAKKTFEQQKAEIRARVEDEDEATELIRELHKQLTADIAAFNAGLTATLKSENKQRVEDVKEAVDEVREIKESAAKEDVERAKRTAGAPIGGGLTYGEMMAMQVGRTGLASTGRSVGLSGMTGGFDGTAFIAAQQRAGVAQEKILEELRRIHQDQLALLRMG